MRRMEYNNNATLGNFGRENCLCKSVYSGERRGGRERAAYAAWTGRCRSDLLHTADPAAAVSSDFYIFFFLIYFYKFNIFLSFFTSHIHIYTTISQSYFYLSRFLYSICKATIVIPSSLENPGTRAAGTTIAGLV